MSWSIENAPEDISSSSSAAAALAPRVRRDAMLKLCLDLQSGVLHRYLVLTFACDEGSQGVLELACR